MLDNKQQKYKSVTVKETCKTAEITDAFHNLRFKVTLTGLDVIHDGKYLKSYEIQVVNYFISDEPLIILERPEDGEPRIYNYDIALQIYNDCVRNYTNLVKAETRDMQDIDIYKTNIGYKMTCPKCCATCKWYTKKQTPHDFVFEDTAKYECHNPKNCKEYTFAIESQLHKEDIRRRHDQMNGHKYRLDDDSHMIIYPNVDKFGICDNYELILLPRTPVPGESITNIIDTKINHAIPNRIIPAVELYFDEQLENNPPNIYGDR